MSKRAHLSLQELAMGQPGRVSLPPAYLPHLPTRALGSLQGVELHHFLGSRLDVGGEIAGAVFST